MTNPEKVNQNIENNLEKIGESAKDQIEKLSSKNERESTPENKQEILEKAKQEAREHALSKESGGAEKHQDGTAPSRKGPISRKELDKSFSSTMSSVREGMRIGPKLFSKAIHTKPIEKASDIVGSTVARPNAILYGSAFAFISTLVIYIVAKYYGYSLSGSESILAFSIGWVIGIIFDYLKTMITGKK